MENAEVAVELQYYYLRHCVLPLEEGLRVEFKAHRCLSERDLSPLVHSILCVCTAIGTLCEIFFATFFATYCGL